MDHYSVLGLGTGASEDEVERAYGERLRLLEQPDTHGPALPEDVTREQLEEAHRVLRSAALRELYDESLARPAPVPPGAGQSLGERIGRGALRLLTLVVLTAVGYLYVTEVLQ